MFRQDYYTDIAIATGATFVAKETGLGLEKVTMDMLGQATKAILRYVPPSLPPSLLSLLK